MLKTSGQNKAPFQHCLQLVPILTFIFHSGFMLKVHSSDAFNQRSTIIRSLALFVSGSLHAYMLGWWGKIASLTKHQLWFCLIVLNERWHIHSSARHPMVVGWGERWVDLIFIFMIKNLLPYTYPFAFFWFK